MVFPVFATLGQTLFGLLLSLTAIFMILLILVQRGRGGGLAGALGGMGGSSAFGAKAGDVFTKITAWSALFWILLCIAAARMGGSDPSRIDVDAGGAPGGPGSASITAPADESADAENQQDAARPAAGEGADGADSATTPPAEEKSGAEGVDGSAPPVEPSGEPAE